MEPQGTLFTRACHLYPVLSYIIPVYTLPSYFFNLHFDIILPAAPQSSKWFLSFFQIFPPQSCMNLFSPPYVPHTLPISFFLIWPPEYYFVSIIYHEALEICAYLRYYAACSGNSLPMFWDKVSLGCPEALLRN